MSELTPEQEARDILERMGIEDAQLFTSGDLVELAELISDTRVMAKSKKIIKGYIRLENAVRDLYYADGDLGKVWVDSLSAINWMKRNYVRR